MRLIFISVLLFLSIDSIQAQDRLWLKTVDKKNHKPIGGVMMIAANSIGSFSDTLGKAYLMMNAVKQDDFCVDFSYGIRNVTRMCFSKKSINSDTVLVEIPLSSKSRKKNGDR